jgi:hypothetical protein
VRNCYSSRWVAAESINRKAAPGQERGPFCLESEEVADVSQVLLMIWLTISRVNGNALWEEGKALSSSGTLNQAAAVKFPEVSGRNRLNGLKDYGTYPTFLRFEVELQVSLERRRIAYLDKLPQLLFGRHVFILHIVKEPASRTTG